MVFKRFEDHEIRYVGAKVDATDGLQRAIAVMRGDADVMGPTEGSDLLGFKKTAAIHDVRLDHMRGLSLQEIEQTEARVDVFTGSDAERGQRPRPAPWLRCCGREPAPHTASDCRAPWHESLREPRSG